MVLCRTRLVCKIVLSGNISIQVPIQQRHLHVLRNIPRSTQPVQCVIFAWLISRDFNRFRDLARTPETDGTDEPQRAGGPCSDDIDAVGP